MKMLLNGKKVGTEGREEIIVINPYTHEEIDTRETQDSETLDTADALEQKEMPEELPLDASWDTIYTAGTPSGTSGDYIDDELPVYQGDRLLATICAGVVGGIGDALIYMNNSSTGGLDFITMAIKARHPYLAFGNLTFAAALAVIVLSGAVFRDVDSIIYGIMFNFLVSTVINKMMFGFTSSMLAMIITDDGAAACAEIDRVADRGSTILQGRGGYGGHPRDVVLCACSNKQLYEIEHAMQALDPGCFIIMLQSNEVHGEGFRQLELGKNENRNE